MTWIDRIYNSGTCFHTDIEISPWFRVDLEQRIAVSHVKIYNRDRYGWRLCGFEIRIGDTTEKNGMESPRCGRLIHIPTNQDDVVACEPPLVGRYVTIVIAGRTDYLMLCEVEVYGKSVLGESPYIIVFLDTCGDCKWCNYLSSQEVWALRYRKPDFHSVKLSFGSDRIESFCLRVLNQNEVGSTQKKLSCPIEG